MAASNPLPRQQSCLALNLRKQPPPDASFAPADLYFSGSSSSLLPSVGERIEYFWPIDDAYYPGVIFDITDDGHPVFHYEDGDSETLQLEEQLW